MWGFLLSLVSALPGFTSGLFKWLDKKTDVDLAKYQSDAQERISAARISLDIRRVNQQSAWTAWMLPSAFTVAMAHWSAIVFDSLPLFGHRIGSWGIPDLPGDYAGSTLKIIMFAIGAFVTLHGINGFRKK